MEKLKKIKHPISDAATCTCKSLSLVIHSMTPQALVTSRSMTVTGVKKTKATHRNIPTSNCLFALPVALAIAGMGSHRLGTLELHIPAEITI